MYIGDSLVFCEKHFCGFSPKQLNVKRMGKVLFSNLIPFLLLSTEGNFTASQDTKSAKLHMTPTHAHNFFLTIFIA